MNDQGNKLNPDPHDDPPATGAEDRHAPTERPADIAAPVEGKPEEDAAQLASGSASGLDRHAGQQEEQVADTSDDPAAAREALDETERALAEQVGAEPIEPAPDVLETPASDDTVTDEPPPTSAEGADEGEADEAPEPVAPPSGPLELDVPEEEPIHLEWYILKVQSNRERSIAEALRRKIAIEGLDDYFGEVLVPTERVTEFKGGKKKIVERKLWPGYIAVQMHVNDDTWFAIRETSGIGDFTGSAGKPTPMQPHEVAMILHTDEEETDEAPKLDIKFNPGDKVKVKEGNFENFEGEVHTIDETHGRVTVMLSIFGRPTPVELEYWQVESV